VTLLILLLVVALLLYLCLSRWMRTERDSLGVGDHVVVSADDSARGAPTLRSRRYGLVGRPDQLVRAGRMVIPVEQKPTLLQMLAGRWTSFTQSAAVARAPGGCAMCAGARGVRSASVAWIAGAGRRQAGTYRVHAGARAAAARHDGADAGAVTRGHGPRADVGRREVYGVRVPGDLLGLELRSRSARVQPSRYGEVICSPACLALSKGPDAPGTVDGTVMARTGNGHAAH
jgi:hypothetical protein